MNKFFLLIVGLLWFLPSVGRASLLVDDFNDGAKPNNLSGDSGTTINGTGLADISFYNAWPADVYGQDGYSLKLEWTAASDDDWAGYWLKLSSGTGGRDISGYKYLSFRVKGESGGEYFKIQLKNAGADAARNSAYLYISDYLDGGVTAGWQKVNIPLEAFVNLDSLANVTEIAFVFEGAQSSNNGSPTSGVIYLDNIIFGDWFSGITRIDSFGDRWLTSGGVNALGGNMGDMGSDPTALTYSISTDTYHNYANGLFSPYDVTTGWAGIWSIFGGGAAGVTAIPHDFSAYDQLVFWAKAESTDKNPQQIKLELADTDGNHSFSVSGITASWQIFLAPLGIDGFNLDKSSIKQMNIVYESGPVANTIGAVYFDEFEFQGSPYGIDTVSPAIPANFQDDGVAVNTGHSFGVTNVLSSTAGSLASDSSLEGVRFEYLLDPATSWQIIHTDYDTSDTDYSAVWDTSGLAAGATVYLRAVAFDALGNEGAMTEIQGTITGPPDTTSPSAITDLQAAAGNAQALLSWMAPGDDNNTGTAALYEVRYSTFIITTEADFSAAGIFFNSWVPKSAGSAETGTITGLTNGTKYYFALKAVDEAGNPSAISNVAEAAPVSPPVTPVVEKNLDNLVVYPNPYRPNSGSARNGIIFGKLTGQAKIEIYTLTGQKLKEIQKDNQENSYRWDGRNEQGEELASGVYLAIVTNEGGEKKTGKIVIMK